MRTFRSALGTLALVAVAPSLAVAQTASTPAVLKGCSEVATRPGERKLTCSGFSLTAGVEQPAFATEQIIEMIVDNLKREPRAKVEKVTVPLSGGPRSGLRYTMSGAGGKPLTFGLFAMVPSTTPSKIRAVGCEEPRPGRCETALAAMALEVQEGVAPTKAELPAGPRLAGRDVDVPAGCSFGIEGPKTILRCGRGNLSWVELAAGDPEGVDWIYAPLKKALATQGTLSERLRPCSVEGVKAECRDVEVRRGDGARLNMTAVMASLRGQRVWLQCNTTEREGNTLPPPCSSLVRFD